MVLVEGQGFADVDSNPAGSLEYLLQLFWEVPLCHHKIEMDTLASINFGGNSATNENGNFHAEIFICKYAHTAPCCGVDFWMKIYAWNVT